MFENVRALSRYISKKAKTLGFNISDIEISRNDTVDIRNKIYELILRKGKN